MAPRERDPTSDLVAPRTVLRVRRGVGQYAPDRVAIEAPLQIRTVVDGVESILSVTMRTPGDDEALAVGLLWGEGVLTSRSELRSVRRCANTEHLVRVELARSCQARLVQTARRFASTGSCGLCGKTSLDAVMGRAVAPVAVQPAVVAAATLHALPAALCRAQATFESTGAMHAVAAFAFDGRLHGVHEDIGRHNAFDKLVGAALLDGSGDLQRCIAVLSGRAGFELVQKAAAARMPVVAAIGAPSSLAVELAEQAGITLIGFLSSERFNVYTHATRVAGVAPSIRE